MGMEQRGSIAGVGQSGLNIVSFCSPIYNKVYLALFFCSLAFLAFHKDISERYAVKLPDVLKELTDDLCSSVGSLTNAKKIADTLAP